ncbi:hypothetical protein DSO57_1014143 [Entomophthora muscae]|uniref:Uncharacterized protein n=1 Tax=Entomophthora muscae TaxID=34485 RepID=A0ACC2S7J2_9FUNG|nr:hypothetical protein DSO57_1014143 [Entomophthora muscae]
MFYTKLCSSRLSRQSFLFPLIGRKAAVLTPFCSSVFLNAESKLFSSAKKAPKNCPYKTLRLNPGVSFQEIKGSYRKLCFELHPDRSAMVGSGKDISKEEEANSKRRADNLVEVIHAFQYLRELQKKGTLGNFGAANSSSQQSSTTFYPGYYPKKQSNEEFSGSGDFRHHSSLFGDHQHQSINQSRAVLFIISVVFVGLGIHYARFVYYYGSVAAVQEENFRLAAETYVKVRELAYELGFKERIELFLKQYKEQSKKKQQPEDP